MCLCHNCHTESTDATESFSDTDDTNLTDGLPNGKKSEENQIQNLPKYIDEMTNQELAVWYNDNVIYPNNVRLNCYYYRHYSFIKDIQMILCSVFGKKMEYNGELI